MNFMNFEDIRHGMIVSWVLDDLRSYAQIIGSEPDEEGDWEALLLTSNHSTMHVWLHPEMELINFDDVIDGIMDV